MSDSMQAEGFWTNIIRCILRPGWTEGALQLPHVFNGWRAYEVAAKLTVMLLLL